MLRSCVAVGALLSVPQGAQAGWSDILSSFLGGGSSSSSDVDFRASVVAESDTDLNFTSVLSLDTDNVDINATLTVTAAKCDTRNMEATVSIDMMTPDLLSQLFCLFGASCNNDMVTTNLLTDTFPVVPDGNWETTPNGELRMVVDLTPWNVDDNIQVVFADVEPMLTGLSFNVELYGMQVDSITEALGSCSTLDAVLAALGIDESDLGLDDGTLCSYLTAFVGLADDFLDEWGLDEDPIDIGRLVSQSLGDDRPVWLSSDGRFTLGQKGLLCQVTPDPFHIAFADVDGNTADTLIQHSATIVSHLVETANQCLAGGSEDYTITSLNFDNITFAFNADGEWEMHGQLWGGAGKNPAGIFNCIAENLSPMQLDDGSTVTPGHSEIEESEHECMMTEHYAQCDGASPPPNSAMQTEPPIGLSEDAIMITVIVCVSAVVLVAVIVAGVVIARKRHAKREVVYEVRPAIEGEGQGAAPVAAVVVHPTKTEAATGQTTKLPVVEKVETP